MRVARLLGTLGLGLALGLGTIRAEEPSTGTIEPTTWPWRPARDSYQPCCPPSVITPPAPQGSGTGSASGSPTEQQPNMQGAQDQFASAQEAGSGAGASAPNMFGDIVGFYGRSSSTSVSVSPGSTPTSRVVTVVNLGGFKISDNESPRPVDRVFMVYNYYNDVNHSFNPPGTPRTDVHRETIGFEKTILDGNASFGLRAPFIQAVSDGHDDSQFGDMTITTKYALVNDADTVLSGGVLITVPTGKAFHSDAGTIHPVYIQPWSGFLLSVGDLYLHGFVDIAIPTDSRDVLLAETHLGVGYWLYRSECNDAILSGVAPTVEIHLNNPLTHRYPSHASDPIFLADQANLTVGTVFIGRRGSQFGLAVGVPLVGPKPFEVEGIASFNLRF